MWIGGLINLNMVKIYSTKNCRYCVLAKAYFTSHGVDYEEVDVTSDAQKRQEMVDKSGAMSVPVIQIGDSFVVGFKPEEFSKLI